MEYLILTALWFIYFTLHSILASTKVKSFFEKLLSSGFRFYRMGYTIISTVGLIALLLFNESLPLKLIFESVGLMRYLSLVMATFGVIVISRAFREYRFSSFVGLKKETSEFSQSGELKYVRHPIYSGTILIVIGFFLFNPSMANLISVSCILFYLPVGIFLEEKKLIEQFGDRYISYRKEVPSIFPKINRRSL